MPGDNAGIATFVPSKHELAALFSHVYATDSLYSSGGKQSSDPNSLGNVNVWGNLPADALGNQANTSRPPSLTTGLSDELAYVAGKF